MKLKSGGSAGGRPGEKLKYEVCGAWKWRGGGVRKNLEYIGLGEGPEGGRKIFSSPPIHLNGIILTNTDSKLNNWICSSVFRSTLIVC